MNQTGVCSTGSRRHALTGSGSTGRRLVRALGDHPVPAGPLAVRWLAHELEPVQAGALTHPHVGVENAGTAARRGLRISYHWLDDRGKPNGRDWVPTHVNASPRERAAPHRPP